MTHARRTVVVAALASAVVLLTGVLAGPAAPAGAAPGPRAPAVAWRDCGDGAQCADVPVPLDHDRPADGTITVALLRLPSTDPAHRRGSLFVDPGGPGVSGVDFVRSRADRFPPAVRAAYDVIGFDPRGIGASTPLRCFPDEASARAGQHQQAFPVTDADVAEWQRVDRVLADACAAHGGPLLRHLSTADVARDLDLLRRAVGDARLSYLGYSYGSYIGMTYANLFPSTVGALVIDGVADPVDYATGHGATSRTQPYSLRGDGAKAAEETLQQFFTLCDQVGCPLAPDSEARYEALLDRVRTDPITFPGIAVPYDYPTVVKTTLDRLYSPQWTTLAAILALLAAQPRTRTGSASPAPASVPAAVADAVVDAVADQAGSPAAYPQFEPGWAVPCSETDNPTSFSAWVRAAGKATARYPHFGAPRTWTSSACALWPVRDDDRYAGPWRATTANSVLVVGTYYDPSTPYSGAVSASRLLENARLLSYAGWGHTAYLTAGNPCVDDAVTRYLVSGALPDRGTVCQPQGTPFGPTTRAVAPPDQAAPTT